MKPREPSRTALGAALHRAAHQLLDAPPLFADPLALRIVGPEAESELRAGAGRHAEASSAPLRALIAARSRFTEDGFAAARERGVHQYVVLGAGLDTFAYRQAPDRHLAVYEVDHPATQAWKREQLRSGAIEAGAHVRYAPVDFETETLADGLARAGFDAGQPAYFAWLGVVPYLTDTAVMATLRFVADLPRESTIVFDYAEPPDGNAGGISDLAQRVAALGEPFRSFYTPDALARELSRVGFSQVEDLDAAAINARYFRQRSDGLGVRGRAHLLRARV